MDIPALPRSWWGLHPFPPPQRSIVELVRERTLDAELAALLWLLVEGRVPVVVAAERSGTGKTTLLTALLDFLPPGTRRIVLEGATETFAWLPHATKLGWRGPRRAVVDPSAGAAPGDAAVPGSTFLLVPELSDHLPAYAWGEVARIAVRAVSIGYGLAATIHADSLEEVLDALRHPPVGLSSDELSYLGLVLVLRPVPSGAGRRPARRVVAAHYVRPLARDEHGHVQRLGPAVLATWDERRDEFEHFAWGVTSELARRVGRRPGDFEAEHARRRDYLAGLAAGGVTELDAVRAALDGFRATNAVPTHPN